jgi:hypothetical protein
MEITRVTTALEKQKTFQEFWLGREKKELYSFEKATSVSQTQARLLPKERGGMSVILFWSPAM